jgi:hypothetical protein
MSRFVSVLTKLATGVAASGLVLAAAPIAAQAAAVKAPPSPCKTFTAKSVDALFGVKRGTRLSEKLTKFGSGSNETLICTIKHAPRQLIVSTSASAGGFGGPLKCYKEPKLGSHGLLCVSDNKKFSFTFVRFERHGIWFSDDYNQTLPKKGARLYTFALAQYNAYKG